MDVLLKVRLVNSLLHAREGVECASGVATITTNKVAATEKNLDILSLPTCIIKHKIYNYMWKNFIQNFHDTNNVHSFHYNCPCCHCVTASMTPLHRELT